MCAHHCICIFLTDNVLLTILLNPLCQFLSFGWYLDHLHLRQSLIWQDLNLSFCCFHLFSVPFFISTCLSLHYLNNILGFHLDLFIVVVFFFLIERHGHLNNMSFFCGKSSFLASHMIKAKAQHPSARFLWSRAPVIGCVALSTLQHEEPLTELSACSSGFSGWP